MRGRFTLGSATVPEPDAADHVRNAGEGNPQATIYLDLACPRCAGTWRAIGELNLDLCVRHFPVASKRPRSSALHAAAEAVSRQSEVAFWEFWDSLLSDRAHVDDPHLWERVDRLGLDLDRFQVDRFSAEVEDRIQRDFRGGIRAGVTATPAGFASGSPLEGDLLAALRSLG